MSAASSQLPDGISVVVPVYNSEGTLRMLVERLVPILRLLVEKDAFEVILVNDGSRDGSWAVVCELAQRVPFVHGINLTRNFGQHNALMCGIRAARFALTCTLDDDLQNPPEEIPKLYAALDSHRDVVYGAPEKEQHGVLRDLASRATKLVLQKTTGTVVARGISAFRMFRTRLRDGFTKYCNPFVSIDVLLAWTTTRFDVVRVKHEARSVGKSNYTLLKLITHAFNMITGFTTWPLRLASLLGFCFTAFGMLVLAYVLGRYLIRGTSVPGFPFLASVIAIFAGAQLFTLGIIGEYLARMHLRMMDRPIYVEAERVGARRSEEPDASL